MSYGPSFSYFWSQSKLVKKSSITLEDPKNKENFTKATKFLQNGQSKNRKSKEFLLKKISVLEVKHHIRSSKALSPLVEKEIIPKKISEDIYWALLFYKKLNEVL